MRRLLALCLIAVAGCNEQGRSPAVVDAPDAPAPPDAAQRTALVVMPMSIDFGSIPIGYSTPPATVTLTTSLLSGMPLTGFRFVILGPDHLAFTLMAGICIPSSTGCVTSVSFNPAMVGPSSAQLVAQFDDSTAFIDLRGTATQLASLQIWPPLHDFGAVGVGTTSARSFMLANATGASTGPIAVSVGGADPSQFAISADSCTGAELAPNGTCTVTVSFSPSSPGAKSASLDLAGAPGGSVTASVLGTGVTGVSLSITPSTFDFGTVGQGNSSLGKMFTITNNAGTSTGVIATSMGGNHPGDFLKQLDQCHNRVLAPGATCTLFVTFEPGPVGMRNARVQVSAAPGGFTAADVSGTCTP